jgi:hypothetical protein
MMAQSNSDQQYKVLVEAFVAEGREYHRGDLLVPSDVPGEISELLHAGLVELASERDPQPDEGN